MTVTSARTLRALPLLLLLAAAGSPLACSVDGTPCFPGDYRPCACDNGNQGLFQCSDTGDAYGSCDCSGKIPGSTDDAGALPDASTDGPVGEGGGLLPFMAPCAMDSQCETGHCFAFSAKGPHCSQMCTSDAMCPKPASPGCNMMGYCKAP